MQTEAAAFKLPDETKNDLEFQNYQSRIRTLCYVF